MIHRILIMLILATLPFTGWAAGGHYPVDDADITRRQ